MRREDFSAAVNALVQMHVASMQRAPIAKIRELSAAGYSQADIARKLGVSKERIRQLCNKHQITCVSGHTRQYRENRREKE